MVCNIFAQIRDRFATDSRKFSTRFAQIRDRFAKVLDTICADSQHICESLRDGFAKDSRNLPAWFTPVYTHTQSIRKISRQHSHRCAQIATGTHRVHISEYIYELSHATPVHRCIDMYSGHIDFPEPRSVDPSIESVINPTIRQCPTIRQSDSPTVR